MFKRRVHLKKRICDYDSRFCLNKQNSCDLKTENEYVINMTLLQSRGSKHFFLKKLHGSQIEKLYRVQFNTEYKTYGIISEQ